MLPDYISLVIHDYERKREEAKDFSLNLAKPSPGSIRDECLLVCAVRFDKKDLPTLRAFFGPGAEQEEFLQAIKKCDIDRFRPLVKFLKGEIKEPALKTVEILAWLIDFEGRPYVFGKKYPLPSSGQSGTRQEGEVDQEKNFSVERLEVEAPKLPLEMEKSPTPASRGKRSIIIVLLLSITLLGIYLLKRNMASGGISRGDGMCMYWAGDHYQQIPCNQKPDNSSIIVIALDSEKLVNFKKITDQDTITDASIGRVGYLKNGGEIEFYTSLGFHPVYPQLRLKPLTSYIINKYIHLKKNLVQVIK